jgi:hypothetical protein
MNIANLFKKIKDIKYQSKPIKMNNKKNKRIPKEIIPFDSIHFNNVNYVIIQETECELHTNTNNTIIYGIVDKILFMMYSLLGFKKIHLRLFMYPHKKLIPINHNFKQENLNTGYTQFTNDGIYIVVYRVEEWEKVLIHELIHALHKHKFDEAQTEFLATLIYFAMISNSFDEYLEMITNNLLFGVNQTLKINKNITDVDFNKPEVKYHILKTTLLMNTPTVLNCDFVLSNANIRELHNNSLHIWDTCINYINQHKPFDSVKSSMRMTI